MRGFKGGGGTSTSYTSQIPEWAAGAHKKLIGQAENWAYDTPYPYYEGERLAGFTPEEQTSFDARRAMYEAGDPYAAFSASQLQQAAGLPGALQNVQSGYQGQDFDFGKFGQAQADEYMSPYMQNVVDIQKRTAAEEFDRQQSRDRMSRVSSGARGGYREALQEMLGGAQQAQVASDIQAKGSQAAFQNAQQQFERDRGALIQAQQMGDASAAREAQMRMAADLSNRDAAFKAAQFQSQLAQIGSDLGGASQARELERIKELERSGVTQREMLQRSRDLEYNEFMKQFEFPQRRMGWLQGIISGMPQQFGQMATVPSASLTSQLMGMGLGMAGLSQALGEG